MDRIFFRCIFFIYSQRKRVDIRWFYYRNRPQICRLTDNPLFRAYYKRKMSQGKQHNQAHIALARRRCDVLFAMMRTGLFIPRRRHNMLDNLIESSRITDGRKGPVRNAVYSNVY
ncbi:hypothetical protein AHS67_18375 [Salmonella enterica subsp. enterica serovar Enteritidis]|uniref:Uncharacterized protein n=1 Tax=Salmonella enterica TaxID=28901 RepID=A0A629K8U6_SALER|nr:hypothetical protein [Salmonella enterica]EBK2664493.1 hypothetical protein [Salmonella enterica subsp. enterica serovar Enteritidis]EBV5863051.1 hypothetical protein [Salmonella enterica subsp. enterica serovar Bere]ECI0839899.1 hypothetical protein [Salmonella enterica subsp. diarizonae]EBC7334595.1 hypothetical protein [Salmonella enterica]